MMRTHGTPDDALSQERFAVAPTFAAQVTPEPLVGAAASGTIARANRRSGGVKETLPITIAGVEPDREAPVEQRAQGAGPEDRRSGCSGTRGGGRDSFR